ncbi:MAG: hypothetical protein JJU05_09910 [Verrucomicrobia bacterium]|nr:hypothetical protein [Verrucomicrobiota bacterium]MCH8527536.1 hypothetical protein [Kiritimatiellia bacterium]
MRFQRWSLWAASSALWLFAACSSRPPLAGSGSLQSPIARYPHIRLQHGDLALWIADPESPEAYYRGQRFVHSAMVVQARWRGHTVFADYGEGKSPSDHDHVGGTAEEFDYQGPASFQADGGNSPFLKIGVGLLRRCLNDVEETYGHWREYEWVARPEVRVLRPEPLRMVFEEKLEAPDLGLGYAMTSTLAVMEDGNGFSVTRSLTNLGSETLFTEHYSHNFLRIDEQAVGSAYELAWSDPVDWRWMYGEDAGLRVKARSLGFEKEKMEEGIYLATDPEENLGRRVGFTLKHGEPGARLALHIEVDRPLWRAVVWGQPDVISPELFVRLTVEPGESKTWTTTYTLPVEPRD